MCTAILTDVCGLQLAKNRLYSFGASTLNVSENEACGGGESFWKVKRRTMKCDSSTQKLSGESLDSIMVWSTASSVMRKNPRRDGTGGGELERASTETDLREIDTWPVRVKPKRSRRMIGRESESIFRDLISASADGRKRRRIRRSGGKRSDCVGRRMMVTAARVSGEMLVGVDQLTERRREERTEALTVDMYLGWAHLALAYLNLKFLLFRTRSRAARNYLHR